MWKRFRKFVKRIIRSQGYEITPTKAALPSEVRADFDAVFEKMGRYRFKFLDVNTFLVGTLSRAHRLGLHKAKPLSVLDIGTGAGYFPFVCQHYGHQAVAIDRRGNDVFEAVPEWLGVDRRYWEINAYQPIPSLGRKFDLITGFMVNFDRFPDKGYAAWDPSEWEFFLRDLTQNHLQPQGRIAFLFNEHTQAKANTMDYLRSVGAKTANGWAMFETPPRVSMNASTAVV